MRIPHGGAVDVQVDGLAIRLEGTLAQHVMVQLARHLTCIKGRVLVVAVGVGVVQERHVQQFFAGATEHVAEGVVHPQQSAVRPRLGDANRCRFVRRGQPIIALLARRLGQVDTGHVNREAARIEELAVLEPAIGGDGDVLDRTVLGLQSRGITFQALATAQFAQDVANHRLIDMKISDGPANVFVRRIPQQGQFGLVGTQDDAVATDDVQADGAVFEEVFQVGILAPQLLLQGVVRRDVLETVDCPLNDSMTIFQGADVDQCHDPRSVRTLDEHFLVTRRRAVFKRRGHRAIFERQRRTVGQVETIGTAKPVAALTHYWRASPQGCCLAVVADQPTLAVAEIHRAGNRIERVGPH